MNTEELRQMLAESLDEQDWVDLFTIDLLKEKYDKAFWDFVCELPWNHNVDDPDNTEVLRQVFWVLLSHPKELRRMRQWVEANYVKDGVWMRDVRDIDGGIDAGWYNRVMVGLRDVQAMCVTWVTYTASRKTLLNEVVYGAYSAY